MLGGAGLAVSASSTHASEAADFAAWVAGARAQREVVLPNGGQPASRGAWLDPRADEIVGGFFSGTRRTLEAPANSGGVGSKSGRGSDWSTCFALTPGKTRSSPS